MVTNKRPSGITDNASLENSCKCRNFLVDEDEIRYEVRARCRIGYLPLTAERNEIRVQSHQKRNYMDKSMGIPDFS